MDYRQVDSTTIVDSTGKYIPIDTDNVDYQAYLAWVAEGNTIFPPLSNPMGTPSMSEYSDIYRNKTSVGDAIPGGLLASDGSILTQYALGAAGTIPQSTGTGLNWIDFAAATPMFADGRLSLSNTEPVFDVASANMLYYVPYLGNKISLYYQSNWTTYSFGNQLTAFLSSLPDTTYDVFCYYNGSTPVLDLTFWSTNTTRLVSLARQDGVLVKSGSPEYRYLGTIYVNLAGVTANTASTRYIWNMYNRLPHPFLCRTTGAYTYSTTAWREAGGISTIGLSRVSWVQGLIDCVSFTDYALIYNSGTNGYPANGIGIDTTTTSSTQIRGIGATAGNWPAPSLAFFDNYTGQGVHFAARLEFGLNGSNVQWYNASGAAGAGMIGRINC